MHLGLVKRMVYFQQLQGNGRGDRIFSTKEKPAKYSYVLSLIFIAGAVFFKGFNNTILGIELSNNLSAYFVYCALFVQIGTASFRVPNKLFWVFGFIAIQTFILNFSIATFGSSMLQLAGLVIFSVTIFSFISVNRVNILRVVRAYYYFGFVASCFALLQVAVFLLFGEAIYLQDMLGGPAVTTGRLAPDVFGVLPRAASITSEPAHFALLLVPAVYLAVLVALRRSCPLQLKNRWVAAVIIIGLLLSFSLLGYIGLALILSVVLLSGANRLRNVKAVSILVLLLASSYLAATQIPLFQAKIDTFLMAPFAVDEYEFTGNDLSGFALISNALVAKSALEESYLLGTGLKTHENSYDRYLPSYFSSAQVLMELNRVDAGSLIIRVASEFGLLGILGLIWFLVKYKIQTQNNMTLFAIINSMCFVYLILYAVRSGSYLDVSFWLFVALYYYSFKLESLSRREVGNTLSAVRNRFQTC